MVRSGVEEGVSGVGGEDVAKVGEGVRREVEKVGGLRDGVEVVDGTVVPGGRVGGKGVLGARTGEVVWGVGSVVYEGLTTALVPI